MQHLVDILVDSAVRDPPELVLKTPAAQQSNGASPTSPLPPTPAKTNGDSPATPAPTGSKHLKIEDRTYFAVGSTTRMLALLVDYLRVIVNLPMLTTDTMSRVVEFLKAWNSRTCQVVLGAGAMRSAGLKNITAKHLGEWAVAGSWQGWLILRRISSFGIAVLINYEQLGSVRARDVPKALEPEAGGHACRV